MRRSDFGVFYYYNRFSKGNITEEIISHSFSRENTLNNKECVGKCFTFILAVSELFPLIFKSGFYH